VQITGLDMTFSRSTAPWLAVDWKASMGLSYLVSGRRKMAKTNTTAVSPAPRRYQFLGEMELAIGDAGI